MASFNKVLLMGNLTRDPEIRYTPSGAGVCQLGLASNRSYQTQSGELKDETCFVDVTVWGKQAESCSKYLKKGSPVFVEGRLRFEQWQDKTSGQNRSKLTVSAERVQFLSSPTGGGQGQGQQQGGYQAPQANSYGQAPQQAAPQAPAPGYGQAPQQAAPSFNSAPQTPPPMPTPAAAPTPAPQQFTAPAMPDFGNNDLEDDIPF